MHLREPRERKTDRGQMESDTGSSEREVKSTIPGTGRRRNAMPKHITHRDCKKGWQEEKKVTLHS